MVTVKGPITESWRHLFMSSLTSTSPTYELGSYVGYNTYMVHGPSHNDDQFGDQLRLMDGVLSVGLPKPAEKVILMIMSLSI
jgi:hypothetical protein